MMKRICFESKKIRKLFFEKVLEFNNIDKWNDFYNKFKISRKTLDSYKSGRLTLPSDLYEKITVNFSKDLVYYFNNNINYLDANWGKIKGGISTYSKHKYIFESGREKALMAKKARVPKFNIKIDLSEELSYFIGLFIGDGFTNKYGRYYLIQFTGDKRKEKYYYSEVIAPISKKLFNLYPIIKGEFKTNALRVNFYSIDLFKLITERFKINAGRKSSTVLIPEEILSANREILLACVAGIYDAEGCFYYGSRKNYKNPYPAIALHMCNPGLIKQISNIFSKNKIKHSFTSNYSTIYIYGKENIKFFLSKIKLLNPKYKEKIESLKTL